MKCETFYALFNEKTCCVIVCLGFNHLLMQVTNELYFYLPALIDD